MTDDGVEFSGGPGGGAVFILKGDYVVPGHEKDLVVVLAGSPSFESTAGLTSWNPRPSRVGFAVQVDVTQPTAFGKNGSASFSMVALLTDDIIVAIKYQGPGESEAVEKIFTSITVDGAPALVAS